MAVIPAKAGTRLTQGGAQKPGPGLRRDDGFCGKTGVLLLLERHQKRCVHIVGMKRAMTVFLVGSGSNLPGTALRNREFCPDIRGRLSRHRCARMAEAEEGAGDFRSVGQREHATFARVRPLNPLQKKVPTPFAWRWTTSSHSAPVPPLLLLPLAVFPSAW